MTMKLALFNNTSYGYNIRNSGTLLYSGQLKQKTFDYTMDVSHSRRVNLCVFEKHPKFGWEFVGHGRVIENVSPRTEHDAPVWKIALKNPHLKHHNGCTPYYTNKSEILKAMGLQPKYKNLALGIIPLE